MDFSGECGEYFPGNEKGPPCGEPGWGSGASCTWSLRIGYDSLSFCVRYFSLDFLECGEIYRSLLLQKQLHAAFDHRTDAVARYLTGDLVQFLRLSLINPHRYRLHRANLPRRLYRNNAAIIPHDPK